MQGILVIDKPVGPTSADVVRVAKRVYREKTGHLGTLDPFASGVLPLCIGEATKVAQLLVAADKEYFGRVRLGVRTDTGDPTGRVIAEAAVPSGLEDFLSQVAASLGGKRLQTPPMYSAIKRGGVPLYKLARRGEVVERKSREVEIEFLSLRVEDEHTVSFRVRCSKGAYMRVLGEEIAGTVGTVGYLEELRRLRFGPFCVDRAVAMVRLEQATEPLPLVPIREALIHLRSFPIPKTWTGRVRQGSRKILESLPEGALGESALVVDPTGEPLAILQHGDRGWEYLRVLMEKQQPAPD